MISPRVKRFSHQIVIHASPFCAPDRADSEKIDVEQRPVIHLSALNLTQLMDINKPFQVSCHTLFIVAQKIFLRVAPGPCETYPDSLNEMNLDVNVHWFYQSNIVPAKNRLLKRYDKCSPEPCKALWLTKAL
jgi:hypothetical protein